MNQAQLNLFRAKESKLHEIPIQDGQLIMTDEGSLCIDFPDGNRITAGSPFIDLAALGNSNLLNYADPNDLEVEYSNHNRGFICQVVDQNDQTLGEKYLSQGISTASWTHCKIPFTTKNDTTSMQILIRKIADDDSYIPADFAFDNFVMSFNNLTVSENLLQNGSFNNNLNYWERPKFTENDCKVIQNGPNGTPCFQSLLTDSSAKYATLIQQTINVSPNTPYKFSMSCLGAMAGAQARIYFFDINNTSTPIKYTSLNLNTTEWLDFTTSFTTGSSVTQIIVAIRGVNSFYCDDVFFGVHLPQIKNGDFTEDIADWYNEPRYLPKKLIEENGNVYLQSDCENINASHTSATLIRHKGIYGEKNIAYALEFDAKRLTESAVWEKYTTIMENDKFALMHENAIDTGEWPKFGGPWATALNHNYILRFIINKPNGFNFNLNYIGLLTSIVSAEGSEVIIERQDDTNQWHLITRHKYNENIEMLSPQEIKNQFKLLPCGHLHNENFKAIRITITFQDDSSIVHPLLAPTQNFVKGIRFYGKPFNFTNPSHSEIKYDMFGNIHYKHAIEANALMGTIDDGSLTWRDL